jgi:hypothetical protein
MSIRLELVKRVKMWLLNQQAGQPLLRLLPQDLERAVVVVVAAAAAAAAAAVKPNVHLPGQIWVRAMPTRQGAKERSAQAHPTRAFQPQSRPRMLRQQSQHLQHRPGQGMLQVLPQLALRKYLSIVTSRQADLALFRLKI